VLPTALGFARLSTVVRLTVGDYRLRGKCGRLWLIEKGNKEKLVWLDREAGAKNSLRNRRCYFGTAALSFW
jgi:hypothetical protein